MKELCVFILEPDLGEPGNRMSEIRCIPIGNNVGFPVEETSVLWNAIEKHGTEVVFYQHSIELLDMIYRGDCILYSQVAAIWYSMGEPYDVEIDSIIPLSDLAVHKIYEYVFSGEFVSWLEQ